MHRVAWICAPATYERVVYELYAQGCMRALALCSPDGQGAGASTMRSRADASQTGDAAAGPRSESARAIAACGIRRFAGQPCRVRARERLTNVASSRQVAWTARRNRGTRGTCRFRAPAAPAWRLHSSVAGCPRCPALNAAPMRSRLPRRWPRPAQHCIGRAWRVGYPDRPRWSCDTAHR